MAGFGSNGIGIRGIARLGVLLEAAGEGCAHFGLRRARGPLTPVQRAEWLHESSLRSLRRLGISVKTEGKFPERGLLVSNHLSYLDIMIYSSLAPSVFVSKKEVRSWPVFGQMATLAGTVYIDRSRAADAQRANAEMLATLSHGAVVILFPEGTSSDGSTVLPFRPALFESVVMSGDPVTPAHIGYELAEGNPGTDVCYWGDMSFLPHILGLLSRRGIRATVRISATAHRFEDRKLAAQRMREKIIEMSGVPLIGSAPK